MTIIRLKHHDSPEELKKQIKERFGTATVEILKIDKEVAEIQFDDRELPWRYHEAISDAITDLMEENEWVYYREIIG